MSEKQEMPRILLAGANSGCGKTSITCGILKALTDRNMNIQSYKCGPDYIDPMLHGHITGTDCRNLDPFFSSEEDLRRLMAKDSQDVDFSVIEGVMGYYDGIGVSSEKSTHTVSQVTETPTILIVNVKGMSGTMIPIIRGLLEYRENPVKGVILNRCSKGLYTLMKPEIEAQLPIKVVGYFPQNDGVHIGSRHLGLMTAAEITNLDEVITLLGEVAKECIDLDMLLELGQSAPPLEKVQKPVVPDIRRARIAVAWDKAFCFYYIENLEILEQAGAELVFFSPIKDRELPENIGGIYLGGGKYIAADGSAYGVRIGNVTGSGFTHWFRLKDINYKEEEMAQKETILYNGKEYTVELIRKDGVTYLKTRDIAEVLGLSVSSRGKTPVLADK